MVRPCLHCKSTLHTQEKCSLYAAMLKMKSSAILPSLSFRSVSPAPFVGRFGYPNVNVGILAPPVLVDNAAWYDAPREWALNNVDLSTIASLRLGLMNNHAIVKIKTNNRFLETAKQVALSIRPIDADITLSKQPHVGMTIGANHAPFGPTANVEKIDLASNSIIPTKVERAVNDPDASAVENCSYLQKHGFDENYLTRMLSVGLLGVEARRKIVPTRWAITAIDDTLGKKHIASIREFPLINSFEICFGGYLGNYYLILLFPHSWQYELFETFVPAGVSQSATDYEGLFGRSSYAENCAGGYYAPRLAISEHLVEQKRQASVLVFRFITSDYSIPLGVWVTREASRKALQLKSISFSSKELLLTFAKRLCTAKFGLSLEVLLAKSKLLKGCNQRTLI